MFNERKLTKSELEKREDIVMGMKKNKREFTQRYGKDAEDVMYSKASELVKSKTKSMDKNKIREIIKKTLTKEEKDIEVGADRYEGEQELKKATNLLDDLEQKLQINKKGKDIQKIMDELKSLGYEKDAQKLYTQYNTSIDLSDKNINKEKQLNERYGMSLEDAKAEAKRIAKEEGVVQHVEETEEGSGEYRVSDWYDSDLTVATYDHNGYLSEEKSYQNPKPKLKESNNFEGTGLIVTGRTQIDNNEISDMLDETNYYGVWNVIEGYWFFPEKEETLDSLEMELSEEFAKRGINAKFEGQFNESKLNEDWGSSDEFAILQSMHEDLGTPTTPPSIIDVEEVAQDANDFYRGDESDYDRFKESITYRSVNRYYQKFFPEFYEGMKKMFSKNINEVDNRDINAKFEGQFNESLKEQKIRSIIKKIIKEEMKSK
jgi:hypothetical protein